MQTELVKDLIEAPVQMLSFLRSTCSLPQEWKGCLQTGQQPLYTIQISPMPQLHLKATQASETWQCSFPERKEWVDG